MNRARTIAALVFVMATTGWLIAVSPISLVYAAALATAFGYCHWLERHHDPVVIGPEPTPDGGVEVEPLPLGGVGIGAGDMVTAATQVDPHRSTRAA